MFASDVGTFDLFVYVADPDMTPDQDPDARFIFGCKHGSGRITWGTRRFVALERGEPFCSRMRELPVSRITELQAAWLGNRLDCQVNREASRSQPVGLRTFSWLFR